VRRLLAGEYKWIVFGDDDRVFFSEGNIRALETCWLDANMPYFVSGAYKVLFRFSSTVQRVAETLNMPAMHSFHS
jgi:hypothetical protein